MNASTAREYVLDRALAVDPEGFEILCKMLVERAERTRDLELTPFRADGGIDVHAVVDRDLFHARLGIQAKQYAPGNPVGAGSVRSFKGALTDGNYHLGTIVTTSSFTSGAEESAELDHVRLIDGEQLAEIMVDSEIGVVERETKTYEADDAFWAVFDGPERTAVVPSLEVPQADDFDTLRLVLQAIDAGRDRKPDIAGYVEAERGDTFDPRQADYYGMAAWLLGFAHKEQRVEFDGREVRRWGLTRNGEAYLTHLDRGDDDAARRLLHDAIRDVEVVGRVYDRLREEGTLRRRDIAGTLDRETKLGGSTTARRALSVGRWLDQLPEIRTDGSGPSQTFEYVRGDLSDF